MGCSSCSSGNGTPKGCKNNGTCGTDGCNKLTVFDWLSNMKLPNGQKEFDCVEVRFKNERKDFYQNTDHLKLQIGDAVVVQAKSGHDVGIITLKGELVRIKMRNQKRKSKPNEILKIYRKANPRDIQVWKESREQEQEIMMQARRIAVRLELEMKISDVEFQGDGTKITFYYTADGRVDFRQLIREFAVKFGKRIEMKQIGHRQEAAKVGGIGSCGRELCCSTWLTDFRSVTTSAARYQQLSINSQKLAGQCGKLKCCLNFELDSYLDALQDIPKNDSHFVTEKGKAVCVKLDVFKRIMWFTYPGGVSWYEFSVDDVKEFIAINKSGNKTSTLEELAKENVVEHKAAFVDVVEEDSLDRFERKNKRRRNNQRNKSRSRGSQKNPNNQKNSHQNKPKSNQNRRKNNNQNRGKKK